MFFLKCFSKSDKSILFENIGPHKFDKDEIMNYFKNDFDIKKSKDRIYAGSLKPEPKALFFVMKKLVKL